MKYLATVLFREWRNARCQDNRTLLDSLFFLKALSRLYTKLTLACEAKLPDMQSGQPVFVKQICIHGTIVSSLRKTTQLNTLYPWECAF